MHVTKAVITAAARGVRLYPAVDSVQYAMFPLVDRDGIAKPVIQIIAEEALDSGIEDVCIVCTPGDEAQYLHHFRVLRESLLAFSGIAWAQQQAERLDTLLNCLHFAVQTEPLGYGHAVSCAREFTAGAPFLLLLGDHLYLSTRRGQRCAEQLLAFAQQEACAVSAVRATHESLIGNYGTLTGQHAANQPGVYRIERLLEKPSVSIAELSLMTPGLRAGFYLCFFGMHVLTPSIFEQLDVLMAASPVGDIALTPALQALAERERYLALELSGVRYDIGRKFGMLRAQIPFALAGDDREAMLTTLVELMAETQQAQLLGNTDGST